MSKSEKDIPRINLVIRSFAKPKLAVAPALEQEVGTPIPRLFLFLLLIASTATSLTCLVYDGHKRGEGAFLFLSLLIAGWFFGNKKEKFLAGHWKSFLAFNVLSLFYLDPFYLLNPAPSLGAPTFSRRSTNHVPSAAMPTNGQASTPAPPAVPNGVAHQTAPSSIGSPESSGQFSDITQPSMPTNYPDQQPMLRQHIEKEVERAQNDNHQLGLAIKSLSINTNNEPSQNLDWLFFCTKRNIGLSAVARMIDWSNQTSINEFISMMSSRSSECESMVFNLVDATSIVKNLANDVDYIQLSARDEYLNRMANMPRQQNR